MNDGAKQERFKQRESRVEFLKNNFEDVNELMNSWGRESLMSNFAHIEHIEQVVLAPVVRLNEISSAFGTESAQVFLIPFVTHICEVCSLADITEAQLEAIICAIYAELHMINLRELVLFSNRLIRGKYVEFYGKLTPQNVSQAASMYRKERSVALQRLEMINQSKTTVEPEDVSKFVRKAPDYIVDPNTGEKRESIFFQLKKKYRNANRFKKIFGT